MFGPITYIIEFIIHIDKYLELIIQNFGNYTYLVLFFIIFMETGFVITPFLPGDSLLFAAGALSSISELNILISFIVVSLAAVLGDTVNYWIGNFIGPKVFESNSRLLKKEHLKKAQAFYEKHGGKAILLARFVPIVRTFAPFVAGVSKMNYEKFLLFNVTGGILWVSIFIFGGYYFGNIAYVRQNFHIVVFLIIILSLVPILYEWVRSKYSKVEV